MWGAIAGAALGLGGSIAGAIMGNRAHKKYMAQLDKDEKENQNWFNRRYNEDVTQRHSNQLALTRAEDAFKKYLSGERGKTAVAGGTEESAATAKANATAGISNAVAQVAAQGDARKDKIEEQYRSRKQDISDKRAGAQASQAQQISDSIGQLTNVAGDLISTSADTGSTKKKATATGATDTGSATDIANANNVNINSSGQGLKVSAASDNPNTIANLYDNVTNIVDLANLANNEEYNKIRGLA